MGTKPMTRDEAVAIFDQAIAKAETPQKADNARLLKAYCTDPEFRKALEDRVAAINGVAR